MNIDRLSTAVLGHGGRALGAQSVVHERLGTLRLRRRRILPCWETTCTFPPSGHPILLRLETALSRVDPPNTDQVLFFDYLAARYGLALSVALPTLQRALTHYVNPSSLRTLLDEFTLVSLTVPVQPCVPSPVYEFGYDCTSEPGLSFAVQFRGWLAWPAPEVVARVDYKDEPDVAED